MRPLDEAGDGRDRSTGCARAGVEAVAVCLLWSIVNPAHELRVGELLARAPAGRALHAVAPAQPVPPRVPARLVDGIDASLKPMMARPISAALERAAARGRASAAALLIVTSQGGVMDADDVAEAPIHSLNSGPSMAPVAGRALRRARRRLGHRAIVADTGGTTYDVSLVRERPHPVDARDLARRAATAAT